MANLIHIQEALQTPAYWPRPNDYSARRGMSLICEIATKLITLLDRGYIPKAIVLNRRSYFYVLAYSLWIIDYAARQNSNFTIIDLQPRIPMLLDDRVQTFEVLIHGSRH